jgi:hypothetical protein
MPHRLYHLVAERARHRCEYCLAFEKLSNSAFEVEHIQPRHTGGSEDESNLALSCRACNGNKGTAVTASDPLSNHIVRIFNPRFDLWSEHFDLDLENGVISGRTDTGRATVARLRMNDSQALAARYLWILLFAFPTDPDEHAHSGDA